jgi:hypothetical protein
MDVWCEAEDDQADNREYAGYALFKWTAEIPAWRKLEALFPRETRKRYPRKIKQHQDTFLVSLGFLDFPPGDNYRYWGWQNDYREGADEHLSGTKCVEKGVPVKTVAAFEAFASDGNPGSLRIGDWEIASWDSE